MSQSQADVYVQRAMLLHNQRRYADAERELRHGLGQEPAHAGAHALLALTLLEQDRLEEATSEAGEAIGLAPDNSFTYYAMAAVYLKRNRQEQAIGVINQAIALSPYNPSYLAILSAAEFERRDWAKALEAAERGLAIDPEHDRCVNMRAMALVKLGRRAEAGASIQSALQRDPEDAASHANLGWTLLHEGNPRKAMEHFREALRLEPGMEWARAGIVEALKARNSIYRVMLAYFLWMGRLSQRAQWGILVGGYVGSRLLLNLVESSPQFGPILWPVLILYIVFVYMTWLADPLFNLMLRLDRFGRYALSRRQVVASNWTGGMLLAAVVAALLWWRTGSILWLITAICTAALLVPVSSVFKVPRGWPRLVMIGYVSVLALMAAAMIYLLRTMLPDGEPSEAYHQLQNAFVLGIILQGWIANALMGLRVRR